MERWAPTSAASSKFTSRYNNWLHSHLELQGTVSIATLSDDNGELEVVSFGDGVLGGNVPVVNVEDRLGLAVRLPRRDTRGVVAIVVLVKHPDGGNVVGETGDDVEPGLVVVDAHGDEEGLLAFRGHEAQHACSAAATHGQLVHAVGLGPGAAVGVVPVALLDDLEPGVGVALVDGDFDGIFRHSVANQAMHATDEEIGLPWLFRLVKLRLQEDLVRT